MNANYLEYPVFICGHRKTGTTMLINLFDGAKDAVVFPDDSSFFYMYYPRYDSNKYSRANKIDRLADFIAKEHLVEKIYETNCTEKERKVLLEKQKKFYKKIKNYGKQNFTTKEILQHFIESFRQTFFPEVTNPKVWIEKTTSTEIYALELIKIFPNAKFIHLIRDPRDNWASLKSGWDKKYKYYNDCLDRLMHSLLERGKLGMEFAKHNTETINKEHYKVVKYEEITAVPRSIIKEIANFIGIDFNRNLLRPSTFGFVWRGNSFDGIESDKPTNINVNRWKERITEEEAQLVEYYFRDIMKYFGYKLEFDLKLAQKAAINHYKWYNFSTKYSAK